MTNITGADKKKIALVENIVDVVALTQALAYVLASSQKHVDGDNRVLLVSNAPEQPKKNALISSSTGRLSM